MSLFSRNLGEGPQEVVFLHGLFGQGKNWHSIAKGISDVATSHLVDLPNHGRSSWTQSFDYDGHAELVAQWICEHCCGPVTLIGHSMGGKVAMRLALHAPSLVHALVVVDISPARNLSALQFTSLVAGLKSLSLDSVTSRGYADHMLAERIPDKSLRQFLLQNLQRKSDSWSWMPNLDLLGDNLDAISGWQPIDRVYQGPTMWIVGGKSDYVRLEHSAPMKALFPSVRTITLKRAGHWVHADDPDSFVATLRAFLERY